MRKLLVLLIVSFAVAIPLGGFAFGFVHCKDCGAGISGILGRVLIGIVFTVLTVLFAGYPPQNEGGVGEPYNVWPYIVTCWTILLVVGMLLMFLRRRQSNVNSAA
jgi:hypothetical protein